jgi:hypothetical protein
MPTFHDRWIGLLTCSWLLLVLLGVGCKKAPKKQVWIQDGVEMVSNPAVPLGKNPGRVLKLEERLRIRDVGDQFFFKFPAQPELGPEGSIFVMDQDQLLRFSSEGAFLGNLCKPGQGPGEIQSLERYVIEDGGIYAFDGAANKIVHMTVDGRYLDDRRPEGWFETMTRSWTIGSLVNLPQAAGVLADAKFSFFCTSRSDETLKKSYLFLGKFYKKPPVMLTWDKLTWVGDSQRDLLFISHTREYGIKVLDLNAGRVIRSFWRRYPRVKYVVPDYMKAVYRRKDTPRPEFESDVLELFLVGESLWVRTSTTDRQRGQLFDVFNVKGDYLDSFYVPVKDPILGIRGDTLFVKETADDGTISIALSRMRYEVGPGSPAHRP